MQLQELLSISESVQQLLNLIEVYKFGIVTEHKKKEQFQQELHQFIEQEYIKLKNSPFRHTSLIHYNYYHFLEDYKLQPIEELTVGNTIKYISNIQERLFKILHFIKLYL
ncbi:hypothetical protein BUZ14_02425 [Staphylococcus gallinarum]|uniref:Uncharacterized protein n=1 Tax=Staphylococcus gallinarum TaxID=1293 RepID=A0A3A0W5F9_STAGA|nr:hypothetical protein [Staphylococcus gallinarum]RIP37431.1 hypothetical protein BUZ14_02425 [Staphylococcus gallinarum]